MEKDASPKAKKKILAVLANYGDEQLSHLELVVNSLRSFKKYEVTIVVHSNIPLESIHGIDKVTIFDSATGIRSLNDLFVKLKWGRNWSGRLFSFQMLPMTCRKAIDEAAEKYDYFIFSENDHLWMEHHVDNFIKYEKVLPENRISGLIQYEENDKGRFYPAYHPPYNWDYNSVEKYGEYVFAHFNNVHQGSFLLSQKQLFRIKENHDFGNFMSRDHFSLKCKTNTDIYQYCGMKKLICISEFDQNLIRHLPDLYIDGEQGRVINRAEEDRMQKALAKLLNQ